ncbi:Hypp5032 [Branchiostoma lanceolatum]|uniref:Hypp5032 protein n=1 Tax=Branchiostoma lanceolatum TaxID=7740 RepID=A0A8K0F0K9_BRALA|nr:Hypp5032 [Branchiostoma lanceolatum]
MSRLSQLVVFLVLLVSTGAAPISKSEKETSYLRSDITSLKKSVSQVSEWVMKMQTEIKSFRSAFEGINALLTRMKGLPGQIAGLAASMGESSSTVAALGHTVDDLESSVNRSAIRQEGMAETQTRLQQDLSVLRAGQSEIRGSLAALTAAVQRLDSRQDETDARQRATEATLSKVQKDLRDCNCQAGDGGSASGPNHAEAVYGDSADGYISESLIPSFQTGSPLFSD